MGTIETLAKDFQDYSNSLNSGYLKLWKAYSILKLLTDPRVDIIYDSGELLEYLTRCLAMEGFFERDIEKIQRWVIENVAYKD